jgi:hypothetical protein
MQYLIAVAQAQMVGSVFLDRVGPLAGSISNTTVQSDNVQ